MLDGMEIAAEVADRERLVLALAPGSCTRDELVAWLREHLVSIAPE